jgi:predicted esterase
MRSRVWPLLVLVAAACSGGSVDSIGIPPVGAGPAPSASGAVDAAATTANDPKRDGGGPPVDAGARDARVPPPPGPGSGGTGGAGPGEHDVTVAGGAVAMHVPAAPQKPTPLLILLHGQGDTGRNFLNVWLAKGLPGNVLIAAPDDNHDTFASTLEEALRSLYDVDTHREYVYGFSQGGAYAAFLLYDAMAAKPFAAIGLGSSGLAEDPSEIPNGTTASPAVAVVIDPSDPNNTWNQGLHVMEDFVTQLGGRGYDTKLWTHSAGHSLEPTTTQSAVAWMFGHVK